MRAPVPGTVAAINGQVGDMEGSGSSSSSASSASGSGSGGGAGAGSGAGATDASATGSATGDGFVTLAQVKRFKLQVSLAEADIGKVKKGQLATVSVNAVSGLQLTGKVEEIGVLPSSSSSTDAVSYPVTIQLTQGSSRARSGMSASAEIVTSQANGLTVPNQAIQGSTVTVVKGTTKTPTRVQTGVVGDSSTEVVSGLAAGDQVQVTSASAAAGAAARNGGSSTQSANGVTNRLGGAGGFPGGGFPGGGLPGGGAGGGRFRGGP